jgi:hypothetical protein
MHVHRHWILHDHTHTQIHTHLHSACSPDSDYAATLPLSNLYVSPTCLGSRRQTQTVHKGERTSDHAPNIGAVTLDDVVKSAAPEPGQRKAAAGQRLPRGRSRAVVNYTTLRSCSARSVRSHVKSASLRPK